MASSRPKADTAVRFAEDTAAGIFLQGIRNKRTELLLSLNINRVLGSLMIQEFGSTLSKTITFRSGNQWESLSDTSFALAVYRGRYSGRTFGFVPVYGSSSVLNPFCSCCKLDKVHRNALSVKSVFP